MTQTPNELSYGQQQWMLMQAYTRLSYRQYEECLIILKGLMLFSPKNHLIYPMMGYTYLLLDSFEECLDAIDRYYNLVSKNQEINQEVEWIKRRAQFKLNKKTSPGV